MAKILIIARAFAPERVMGAVRPSKLAKYWTRLGHDVTVLRCLDVNRRTDDALLRDMALYGQVVNIEYTRTSAWISALINRLNKVGHAQSLYGHTGPAAENTANSWKKRLLRMLKAIKNAIRSSLKQIVSRSWSRQCTLYIQKHYQPGQFDLVFSSYMDIATHFAALQIKRQGYARKWVADFRDRVSQADTFFLRPMANRLLTNIAHQADAITGASDHLKELIIHSMPETVRGFAEKKAFPVYNGYDWDDLKDIDTKTDASERFVVALNGTVYKGKQDYRPLFQALKELLDEGAITEEEALVRYVGGDHLFIKALTDSFLPPSMCDVQAEVSRTKALEIQHGADALVVAAWNGRSLDKQGILTGKLYEAMMMQVPIIAMVAGEVPGSALGQIIKRLDVGVVWEEADPASYQSLKTWLADGIRQKSLSKVPARLALNEGLSMFDYQNIARSILELPGIGIHGE